MVLFAKFRGNELEGLPLVTVANDPPFTLTCITAPAFDFVGVTVIELTALFTFEVYEVVPELKDGFNDPELNVIADKLASEETLERETQLLVVPFLAKFTMVPLLFPVASTKFDDIAVLLALAVPSFNLP
jgi:hypothetical protein